MKQSEKIKGYAELARRLDAALDEAAGLIDQLGAMDHKADDLTEAGVGLRTAVWLQTKPRQLVDETRAEFHKAKAAAETLRHCLTDGAEEVVSAERQQDRLRSQYGY